MQLMTFVVCFFNVFERLSVIVGIIIIIFTVLLAVMSWKRLNSVHSLGKKATSV